MSFHFWTVRKSEFKLKKEDDLSWTSVQAKSYRPSVIVHLQRNLKKFLQHFRAKERVENAKEKHDLRWRLKASR